MVKVFDFKDLVGLETISGLGANLTDCKLTGNNGLKTVSAEENTFLIQNVFSFYAQQDNSEVICNLLYQMAMVGNRNLKGIKNED
ncbi:MAG: hypothetical protein V2I31_07755 [Mariniphaga sp.]|jgi:hypothetical protein|nr:hypothetical protein [Mariniphaga sp.]